MKYFLTQLIALTTLAVIVAVAGNVHAGNPAVPAPGPFSDAVNNNTPLPVNIGTAFQIKLSDSSGLGGGLSVAAFIARSNASFAKTLGIQGILTGKVQPVVSPTLPYALLRVGDVNRMVDLTVTGRTYAQELTVGDRQAGLYSDKVLAPSTQLKKLCADQQGTIVFCDTASPTVSSVLSSFAAVTSSNQNCYPSEDQGGNPITVCEPYVDGKAVLQSPAVGGEFVTMKFWYTATSGNQVFTGCTAVFTAGTTTATCQTGASGSAGAGLYTNKCISATSPGMTIPNGSAC